MRAYKYLGAALAVVLLMATACGDDDDDDATGGDATEAAGGGEFEAFCTASRDVDEAIEIAADGEAPPELDDALTAAEESAPAEIQEDITFLVDFTREAVASGDPEAFDDEEAAAADERVDVFEVAECADSTSDVVGVDFAYEGFATDLPAGPIGFNFSNEGAELHEMTLLRFNDDVDLSVEELLALPEEEGLEQVSEVNGGGFALPGESDAEVIELESGRYAMVCFIPVGTTPDATEGGSGPPHFTEGMAAEFTVN